VELAAEEAAWHVHDSNLGGASPVLAFTGAAFDAFLSAARAGNSTSAGTSGHSTGGVDGHLARRSESARFETPLITEGGDIRWP
jgi:hypothetical protein